MIFFNNWGLSQLYGTNKYIVQPNKLNKSNTSLYSNKKKKKTHDNDVF